jgi:hypothetical protein
LKFYSSNLWLNVKLEKHVGLLNKGEGVPPYEIISPLEIGVHL